MASDFSGSDTESLPDLNEFLASRFDPNISDNEEEVGGQENADSWGLELRALSLWAIFVKCQQLEFGVRDSHNQTLALAAAAEGTLTPSTLDFKMQTDENLMQNRQTMSCAVQSITWDCRGVILVDLC